MSEERKDDHSESLRSVMRDLAAAAPPEPAVEDIFGPFTYARGTYPMRAKRWVWGAAAAAVLLIVGVVAAVVSADDDSKDGVAAGSTPEQTVPTEQPAAPLNAALTVEPAVVTTPATHTFTVTVTNWASADAAILTCAVPDSGDLADVSQASCDLGSLTEPITVEGGTFTIDVTYPVPPECLVIAAGNAAGTEAATTLVTVEG